jgi:hypothetical protein
MFSWIKKFLADCSTYFSSDEYQCASDSATSDDTVFNWSHDDETRINPASGLMMVGATDTAGNFFGSNSDDYYSHCSASSMHDSSHDSFSSMDYGGTSDMFSSNSFGDF